MRLSDFFNGESAILRLPFLMLAAAAVPLSVFVFLKVYEPSVREA
jgi:hypothetical protein